MVENRTPVKTEYKGIVFDSKSEAVFARCLDVAGHGWIYHPSPHCDHEWDFLVFRKPSVRPGRKSKFLVGGVFYSNPLTFHECEPKPVLIEYKPSEPTMTYIQNLTEKMSRNPIESVIVYGNPWAGIEQDYYYDHCYSVFPVFSAMCNWGWGTFTPLADSGENRPISPIGFEREFQISVNDAVEASKFRFDLKN